MGDCQRVLGIDLGIASCGWGVIEVRDKAGSIFAKDGKPAVGVRCFDAPLVYKTGEPKDAQRPLGARPTSCHSSPPPAYERHSRSAAQKRYFVGCKG